MDIYFIVFYVVFHVGQSVGYNARVFDHDAKYGRCSTQEDSAQVDGDSLFDALDNNANRMKVSKGSNMLISTGKDTNTLIDNNDKKKVLARLPEQSMRPSWRQLK